MESINVESRDRLSANRKRVFWRRQFAKEATRAQTIFDCIVGLALPYVCLYFDPIVFRGGIGGGAVLGKFQLFAYAVIVLETLTLGMWLTVARSEAWARGVGGVLMAGGLFSLVVGILILPFSLIGLMFGIGVMGFIPFLTALVYLRNGLRAFKRSDEFMDLGALFAPLMLGAAFVLGTPAMIQWGVSEVISHSINDVLKGAPQQAATATNRLRLANWIATDVNFDSIVLAYEHETEPSRRMRLAQAYKDITGNDIERRLRILAD